MVCKILPNLSQLLSHVLKPLRKQSSQDFGTLPQDSIFCFENAQPGYNSSTAIVKKISKIEIVDVQSTLQHGVSPADLNKLFQGCTQVWAVHFSWISKGMMPAAQIFGLLSSWMIQMRAFQKWLPCIAHGNLRVPCNTFKLLLTIGFP